MRDLIRQQKRKTMLELLDRGMVMVHLDPRREGVVVPPEYRGEHVLRLNLAYGFNLPALDVDAEGVYAVLSFRGRNFGCTMPWDAIFGMTLPQAEHEGMVWPASMPPELDPFFARSSYSGVTQQAGVRVVPATAAMEQSPQDASDSAESAPRTPPGRRRGAPAAALAAQHPPSDEGPTERGPERRGLSVIEGGGDDEGAGDGRAEGTDSDDPPPKPRPTLTLVKD